MNDDNMVKAVERELLRKDVQNLQFMKRDEPESDYVDANPPPKKRNVLLEEASRIANHELQALFGDQTKLNQCIGQLHRWAFHHRPERMNDGEFTQHLMNLAELAKVFKSPVYNMGPFAELAAGIGIAAECASKEDRQI